MHVSLKSFARLYAEKRKGWVPAQCVSRHAMLSTVSNTCKLKIGGGSQYLNRVRFKCKDPHFIKFILACDRALHVTRSKQSALSCRVFSLWNQQSVSTGCMTKGRLRIRRGNMETPEHYSSRPTGNKGHDTIIMGRFS